jgi:hypothetical protein
LIAQVEVEEELIRLSGLLERQVTELAKRARAAAEAEADHKVAYAKALLGIEAATVGEREAKATLATEDTYRAHKAAAAVLLAAQEAGRSYRAQLDALRSINTNLRGAIVLPRAQGGGHEPSNLLLLCSAHHRFAHQAGRRAYELGLLKKRGDQ